MIKKIPNASEIRDDLKEAMAAFGIKSVGGREEASQKIMSTAISYVADHRSPVPVDFLASSCDVPNYTLFHHVLQDLVATKRLIRVRRGYYLPSAKEKHK